MSRSSPRSKSSDARTLNLYIFLKKSFVMNVNWPSWVCPHFVLCGRSGFTLFSSFCHVGLIFIVIRSRIRLDFPFDMTWGLRSKLTTLSLSACSEAESWLLCHGMHVQVQGVLEHTSTVDTVKVERSSWTQTNILSIQELFPPDATAKLFLSRCVGTECFSGGRQLNHPQHFYISSVVATYARQLLKLTLRCDDIDWTEPLSLRSRGSHLTVAKPFSWKIRIQS